MMHPELNQPVSLDHLARMTDYFGPDPARQLQHPGLPHRLHHG